MGGAENKNGGNRAGGDKKHGGMISSNVVASLRGCRTAARNRDARNSAAWRHYSGGGLFSEHSGSLLAATGGGGLGVLAAVLYRNPQVWKLLARATADRSVLLLPPKPTHVYQPRQTELKVLNRLLQQLQSVNKGPVTQALYITGRPGFGKSQLAREFGKAYYVRRRGYLFRKLFVGTLNLSSSSSFVHSYVSMAMELGCVSELKTLDSLTGNYTWAGTRETKLII